MANPTKIVWRALLWVAPVALIVLGAIFVITSLTKNDESNAASNPANLRDVGSEYTTRWAQRQADAIGQTVVRSELSISTSRAVNAQVYSMFGVIVQVNEKPSPVSGTEPAVETVTNCVEWLVDVTTKIIDEQNAVVMRAETGEFETKADASLKKRCNADLFK